MKRFFTSVILSFALICTSILPKEFCLWNASAENTASLSSLSGEEMESSAPLSTSTQIDSTAVISESGGYSVFKFTPAVTAKYTFESAGNLDTMGYLYNASGSRLTYNDDSTDSANFRLSYQLSAGHTYYLKAKLYSATATGIFDIYIRRMSVLHYDAPNATSYPQDASIPYGDYTSISQTPPVYDVYTFTKWEYNSATFNPGDVIKMTDDIELSANYSDPNGLVIGPLPSFVYKVSFDTAGGYGVPSTLSYIPMVGGPPPSLDFPDFIPFKFPYSFKGWSSDENSTEQLILPGETTTADYVSSKMYAVWEAPTTLPSQGNATADAVISVAGTQKFFSFTPSESGTYVFESTNSKDTYCQLYSSAGKQLAFDDNDGTNKNFQLSFYFKAGTTYYFAVSFADETTGSIPIKLSKNYVIKYDYSTNGGNAVTKTSDSVTSGNAADLSPVATKSGWTFVGWNIDKNATFGLDSYIVTGNRTLYAIYKKELTATFYSATGSSITEKATLYNNDTTGTVTVPTPKSYSGWSVSGWRDDTNTSVREYEANSTITLASNKSFYAVYSKAITLSYNSNGGKSTPASQTSVQYYNAYGSKSSHTFSLASAISKDAFTFKGWTKNSTEGQLYQADSSITILDNTVMYAKWDAVPVEPSKGYSFGNTAYDFGYTSVSKDDYPISYDVAKIIFGTSIKGKQAYRYMTAYDWNGNCCGMAATASLFNSSVVVSPDDYGKADVPLLNINSTSKDYTLKTFIEAMQIAQYTEEFSSTNTNNEVWCYELSDNKTLNDLYNQVSNDYKANKYTVLTLCKERKGGHALLAEKIEDISSTESKITIYDPNFPGETRYMYLRKNASGQFTEWEYNLGSNLGIWGSEVDSENYYSISYIPYSSIENIWVNRSNFSSNNQLFAINSINLSIMNSDGIEIAQVKDGILHTENKNIFCVPNTTPNETSSTLLYLPADSYKIETTDSTSALMASISGINNGMSITTSASAISFELDEVGGCNKMMVENAGDTDTYTIEMDAASSGTNTPQDTITVTGTSNGLTSGITSSSSNLTFVNSNIFSITINGIKQTMHTINAAAGAGGSITPAGNCDVFEGASATFSIVPDEGYVIKDVFVDGIAQGAIDCYTFSNVNQAHNIYAVFMQTPKISGISISDYPDTAVATFVSSADSTIVLALYDPDGTLIDIKLQKASSEDTEKTFTFDCAIQKDFVIKAFMLSSESASPLCHYFERIF